MIRTWPKTDLLQPPNDAPNVPMWEALLKAVGVTELDMELMERAQSKRVRKNAKRVGR